MLKSKVERKGDFTPIPAGIRKRIKAEYCACCGKAYVVRTLLPYSNRQFVEVKTKHVAEHIFPRRWCVEQMLDPHKLWNLASVCVNCHGKKKHAEDRLWHGDTFGFIQGLKQMSYPMELVRYAAEKYGLKEIFSWTL